MSLQIKGVLNRGGSFLRDLLFPPRCVGCGELMAPFARERAVFCPLCRTAWESAVADAELSAEAESARGRVFLTFYRTGHYDGVPERLIYHVKHHGEARVFDFLSARLAPRVLKTVDRIPTRDTVSEESPLLFTYPPRRRAAVSKDGFDQAERLARVLAKTCGGDYATLLCRTHHLSREQKRLDAEERTANAAASYTLEKNAVAGAEGRIVVICDDLCTTGATLERCASLLVEAGAAAVILCSIAVTRKESGQAPADGGESSGGEGLS